MYYQYNRYCWYHQVPVIINYYHGKPGTVEKPAFLSCSLLGGVEFPTIIAV